ncbi:hypothetical protein BT96DRAFT_997734 [Gymnopus androsaceus JB14]|uniref:Uncharacterized protein n=1 Tax=Gymnopus androsaceus JB14 TaxID=1447944 RepID=A0A6A4HDL1_9AGAR|nr:hypothetical protein BT96DRAFT_997734 [Gymnopus androsaceus JB14]
MVWVCTQVKQPDIDNECFSTTLSASRDEGSGKIDPCLSQLSQEAFDWEGQVKCRDDIRVGNFDAGKIAAALSQEAFDWEGQVKCRDDIRVGNFDAGKIAAADFLVFSVLSKPNQAAFNSLRIVFPVSLVTNMWVEIL